MEDNKDPRVQAEESLHKLEESLENALKSLVSAEKTITRIKGYKNVAIGGWHPIHVEINRLIQQGIYDLINKCGEASEDIAEMQSHLQNYVYNWGDSLLASTAEVAPTKPIKK